MIDSVMDIDVYLGATHVPGAYDGPLYFHRRPLSKDPTPKNPWCYFATSPEKIESEELIPVSKPVILEGVTSITSTSRCLVDSIEANIQ